MPRLWTDEEVEILKKYYPEKGWEFIARKTNRTHLGIVQKGRKLNLHHDRPDSWKHWEISFLKRHYQSKSIQSISRTLKRTPGAIVNKAMKLNLQTRYPIKWTPEQVEKLKDLYKLRSYTIRQIAEIVEHPYESTLGEAKKLKIKRPSFFTKEEDIFLKKNYMKLSYEKIGELLGRTKDTIRKHAKLLGIHKCTNQRKWTQEELDYIRANYIILSIHDLCIALNRSYDGVISKGRDLKITRFKKNYWSVEEKNYVISNYYRIPIEQIATELKRTAMAVQAMAEKIIPASERRKRRNYNRKTKILSG